MEIVFIDVETTGLGPAAEVVEIAVLDESGAMLFESLVCPSDPWGYICEEIHGITARELASAPGFSMVAAELGRVLEGVVIAGHGVAFDAAMIQAGYSRAGEPAPSWSGTLCTMELAAERFGLEGRISLSSALARAGLVPPPGRAHRAGRDAEASRLLWLTLDRSRPAAA
ncbi:exonuclease domain-containing protein [Arthrobacter sp. GAS37]|uniref:3'-5' exonuclease n=1 Tax=Arthrobacter sp. GAS37 TaxID=3156261 RepID=UPI00385156E2